MNDKYEREIDDLLKRLEGRMRREPLSHRWSRRLAPISRSFRGAFVAFLRRPPTEQFMIAGMVLVVLSMALNLFALERWAYYSGVLSIVFFVVGLALAFASRHSPGYGSGRRWRGREIDYHAHTQPRWWSNFRNWLRRRGR